MGLRWPRKERTMRSASSVLDDTTLTHVLGVKASVNTDHHVGHAGVRHGARVLNLPIRRAFRDARAGSVMAPTTDALYDFTAGRHRIPRCSREAICQPNRSS